MADVFACLRLFSFWFLLIRRSIESLRRTLRWACVAWGRSAARARSEPSEAVEVLADSILVGEKLLGPEWRSKLEVQMRTRGEVQVPDEGEFVDPEDVIVPERFEVVHDERSVEQQRNVRQVRPPPPGQEIVGLGFCAPDCAQGGWWSGRAGSWRRLNACALFCLVTSSTSRLYGCSRAGAVCLIQPLLAWEGRLGGMAQGSPMSTGRSLVGSMRVQNTYLV